MLRAVATLILIAAALVVTVDVNRLAGVSAWPVADGALMTSLGDALRLAGLGAMPGSAVGMIPLALCLGIAGLLLMWLTRGGADIETRDETPAGVAPNAAAQATPAASAAQTERRDATDREFLPAALELLDTPPSPIRIAAIWFIALAFGTAIVLSYFGKLDIHAVAQGRIHPTGRSKVVQPLEPGKVVALAVENGVKVAAGDMLLELDRTETGADRQSLVGDLESTRSEAVRRRASVAAALAGNFKPARIEFPAGTSDDVRQREQAVHSSELAQLSAVAESLIAQIEEKSATSRRLAASIKAREKMLALTQERVDMRTTVNDQGSLSRAMVIESLQQHQTQMISQETERGQLSEIEASIKTLERKRQETISQFVADSTQKMVEAERKADRVAQELIKASSKNERTIIRAPIAGTVQQLAVNTIGQVVTTGQALLTIVPTDAPVEIEALIQNQDIGFIEPGQRAVVKVEAFPFTRFGTIDGTVVKVSRDAVDEREATGLADASQSVKPNPTPSAASGGRAQSLVFPATVRMDARAIRVEGKDVPLSPGMAVTVEILTGERRVIDYLLAPLREVMQRSAHER